MKFAPVIMARDDRQIHCKAILIELKNNVIQFSMDDLQMSRTTFVSLLYCNASIDYQCGRLTEDEYIAQVASAYKHSPSEIKKALSVVRKSMQVNHKIMETLQHLKTKPEGRIKCFASITMSQEDSALAKELDIDWSLFERVFVSKEMGMQKPELRFYQHVLSETGLRPEEILLVDNETENVLAALSQGLQAVRSFEELSPAAYQESYPKANTVCPEYLYQTDGQEDVPMSGGRPVRNVSPSDTIEKATKFLQCNSRNFLSYTSTGVPIQDNYAQLYILKLTGDRCVWAFLKILTRSLTMTAVEPLSTLMILRSGSSITKWMYPVPETFLFFLTTSFLLRLKAHDAALHAEIHRQLANQLVERIGVPVDAANLAMRLIVCHELGLQDPKGLRDLIAMQEPDGGWHMGTLYHYASRKLRIGNRGLTTVLARDAIKRGSHWLGTDEGTKAVTTAASWSSLMGRVYKPFKPTLGSRTSCES